MDTETREKLDKYIMLGEHAASAQFIIDTIGDHLIEQVKEDFIKMPIIFNQNIDNSKIIMLQLKVEVVKDFQKLVRSYIAKGLEARKKLNGD